MPIFFFRFSFFSLSILFIFLSILSVDTFNNSAGVEIDLGNLNSPVALDNSKSRPPSGTYTDMLMVMGNSFTLKGSYQTAVTTYNTENDTSTHSGKFTPQSSNPKGENLFFGISKLFIVLLIPFKGKLLAANTSFIH